MADIELVIKIPEGLKKEFESEQWTALSCMEMKEALVHGTQLPKGHGRLIDADAVEKEMNKSEVEADRNADYYTADKIDCAMEYIINAPTIIEADKEEKE